MSKYNPFNHWGNQPLLKVPVNPYATSSFQGSDISIYTEPSHTSIYSNEDIFLVATQYNPFTSTKNIPAFYSENRSVPVVPWKSNQYKVCVHNIYLPADLIYLFEWQDEMTNDKGNTFPKYSINVEYYTNAGGLVGELNSPLFFVPFYQEDLEEGAIKRIFNVDQVLISMNNALAVAWASIAGIPGLQPRFYKVPDTNLIAMLFDPNNLSASNQNITNPLNYTIANGGDFFVRISLNFQLYSLFGSSFPFVLEKNPAVDYINNADPYAYFRVYDEAYPGFIQNVGIGPTSYWNIIQTESSLALLSTVQKILLQSDIGIRQTYQNILSIGSLTNNTLSQVNVLADITPPSLFDPNVPIIFNSQLHQWQDIIQEEPIRSLKFNFIVLRSTGVVNEIELKPGKSMYVKLIFSLK